MSIDKFGRHIHKHIVKKHITSIANTKIFLSQETAKEIIQSYIKEYIESEKLTVGVKLTPKRRKILSLQSDGVLNKGNMSYILRNKGNTHKYINKFYTGKILKVHYHPNVKHLSLKVDSEHYSEQKAEKTPYKLNENSVIILRYIGPPPIPDKTQPFAVEILIEEEDVPSEEGSSE